MVSLNLQPGLKPQLYNTSPAAFSEGLGLEGKDAPGSMSSICPDLAKESKDWKTLVSDITSPRPLPSYPPQEWHRESQRLARPPSANFQLDAD